MKPNIVIVVFDAARAKNIPLYGYQRNTTPFLFENKKKFAVYENAISSSYWTMPSVTSLFTGMYTSGHGLVADGDKLDERLPVLPKILKKLGYRSAAFVRNVYVSEYSGISKYFDDFYNTIILDDGKKIVEKISKKFLGNLQPHGIKNVYNELRTNKKKCKLYNIIARLVDVSIDSGGKKFVNDFKKWVRQYKKQPFFAYLHFMETHLPFRAPHRFAFKYLNLSENIKKLTINQNHIDYILGNSKLSKNDFNILMGAYDNSINYIDHLVMIIFDTLIKYKVIDNTMVIITSDHGENIGEHDLMFHYWCLYDTLIKVPLIIKYPKSLEIKKVIKRVAQNVDILPTILGILNVNDEKYNNYLQGNDLLNEKEYRRPKDIAISELVKAFGMDRFIYRDRFKKYDKRLISIRTKDKKFIYSSEKDHEYYDIKKDPDELINLYPDIKGSEELFKYSELYYKKMDSFYQNNKDKIEGDTGIDSTDSKIKNSLKALGYM